MSIYEEPPQPAGCKASAGSLRLRRRDGGSTGSRALDSVFWEYSTQLDDLYGEAYLSLYHTRRFHHLGPCRFYLPTWCNCIPTIMAVLYYHQRGSDDM